MLAIELRGLRVKLALHFFFLNIGIAQSLSRIRKELALIGINFSRKAMEGKRKERKQVLIPNGVDK